MELPARLECRILGKEWETQLIKLFELIKTTKDYLTFHPHPFTEEEAKKLVEYQGKDLYYILVSDEIILGYGMLRGWDEGYSIPSLGIYIHPLYRRKGLGKLMMLFLQSAAQLRGSTQVRLKVYSDNYAAIKLYQKMDYKFEGEQDGQMIGFLQL